jgi:hypothetical protein
MKPEDTLPFSQNVTWYYPEPDQSSPRSILFLQEQFQYCPHIQVPIAWKSGILNLLESYGPLQAYNGIALPLPLHLTPIYA